MKPWRMLVVAALVGGCRYEPVPPAGVDVRVRKIPEGTLRVEVVVSDAAGNEQTKKPRIAAEGDDETRKVANAFITGLATGTFSARATAFGESDAVLAAAFGEGAFEGKRIELQLDLSAPDPVAPTVVSTAPADQATLVALDATVSVTFSERMSRLATEGAFGMSPQPTGSFAWSAGDTTFTFTPSGPLADTTSYMVTVGTGAKDAAGNALAAPFSFSFTTRPLDTTPPEVVSTVPENDATGVSVTTAISATFSEPMDISSVEFEIDPPTLGAYGWAGETITFTPDAALAQSTFYTVTVPITAKDAAGNPLGAARTFSFTTADTTPPAVVSTIPVHGAAGIALDTPIAVTFSEPMNRATVEAALDIDPDAAGTTGWSNGDRVVTLTPTNDLDSETPYTVTIRATAADAAGNTMGDEHSFSFTTEDVTAPTVKSTLPPEGATDVAVDTTVTVVFSEAMDATATEAAFSIDPTVAGTLAWSETNSVLTFTPGAPLPDLTLHTVTIGTQAADVAGNLLAAEYSFSFTTADTTSPVVVSTDPGDGATGVPWNAEVAVTFSEAMDTAATAAALSFAPTLSGSAAWSAGDTVLTFTPADPLPYSTTYTVTVSTAARDAAGNALDAAAMLGFSTQSTLQDLWTRTYSGQRFNHLALDSSGNVYVTGSAMVPGAAPLDTDALARKHDPRGRAIWIRSYRGPLDGQERGNGVAADAAGVYVAGTARLRTAGQGSDFWLRQYDPDGGEVSTWTDSLITGGDFWLNYWNGVALGPAGSMFVAGHTCCSGNRGPTVVADSVVRKYTSDGGTPWTWRPLLTETTAMATDVAVDGAGNVFVAGWQNLTGYVQKLSSSGVPVWSVPFKGAYGGRAVRLALDQAGNSYVVGEVYRTPASYQAGDVDFRVSKYDSASTLIWERTFDGPAGGPDEGQDIALDASSNVYVAGGMTNAGTLRDAWVARLNSNGHSVWARTFGGPADDYATGIAVSGGVLYLAGTNDIWGPAQQAWLRKLDLDGNTLPAGCWPDGKACDADTNPATRDICLADRCVTSRCGDGILDRAAGEQCDDANTSADDACDQCFIREVPVAGSGSVLPGSMLSLAFDPDGSTLWATWQDRGSRDGMGSGIFARRFTSRGVVLGDDFNVSTNGATANQYTDTVAVAPGGMAIFTFYEGVPGDYKVMFRRFARSGAPLDSANVSVTTSSATDDLHPHVAALKDGRFVVTWGGPRRARVYNADGTPTTGEILVSSASLIELPSVAGLPDGGFVVVYRTSDRNVWAKRFNSSGSLLGSEVAVNTSSSGGLATVDCHLASLDDGTFMVAWTGTGDAGDGDSQGIRARRFRADGTAITALDEADFVANDVTAGNQNFYRGLSAGGRQFVLAYGTDPPGLYLRRFSGTGTIDAKSIVVSMDPAREGRTPAVAAASDGTVGVLFEARDRSQVYLKIYPPRALPAAGAIPCGADGTTCDADGNSATHDICLMNACVPSRCGDGIVVRAAGERCDDANSSPDDACDQCQIRELPVAGTGKVSPGAMLSLAFDQDGGTLWTAWEDTGARDGLGTGVYARRFTRSGVPLGSDFLVNTNGAGATQEQPHIGVFPDGSAIIAFGEGPSPGEIRFRRFARSGTALDASNVAVTADSVYDTWPGVAVLENGNAAFLWGGAQTRARVFNASGSPVTNPFVVLSDWGNGALARLPGVGFVAVYGHPTLTGGMRAQRYDFAGSPVGNEIGVSTSTWSMGNTVGVASLDDGTFMVLGAGSDGGLRGRRFSAQGTPLDAADFVASEHGAFYRGFSAGKDQFALVHGGGSPSAIWLRRFSRTGVIDAQEIKVADDPTRERETAGVAVGPDGTVAVMYGTYDRSQVYLKLYPPGGLP